LVSVLIYPVVFSPYVIEQKNFQSSKQTQKSYLIDINNKCREDIEKIPGIGPVIAERIINYISQNGPLKEIEELLNVKGIGKAKLKIIKHYVNLPVSN
jgi:competence protein ComEA